MLRRLPLRCRIALAVSALMLITTYVVGRSSFLRIAELSLTELGMRAQVTAIAAASLISPEWLEKVNPYSDRNTEEYKDLKQRLARLMEQGQVLEINVVRFKSGREVEHVLSFLPVGHPDHVEPGQVENIIESPAYFQKNPGNFALSLKAQGSYWGGWAPILNSDGKQIGNVLVTIDYSPLDNKLVSISNFILVILFLFTALASYTGYRVGLAFEMTAITDGLMGIFNHRYFKQRLESEIARAARYRFPLSLVMLDIDHFKQVNDTYGHAIGDLVLKNLARWVRESTRRSDIVARYGGEEIAIILPHTDLAGAREFAERLRLRVANEWVRDNDEDVILRITISVGVAEYQRGLTMLDFIKRADAALYRSKRSGRNRVTVWTEDLQDPDPAQDKNLRPARA